MFGGGSFLEGGFEARWLRLVSVVVVVVVIVVLVAAKLEKVVALSNLGLGRWSWGAAMWHLGMSSGLPAGQRCGYLEERKCHIPHLENSQIPKASMWKSRTRHL